MNLNGKNNRFQKQTSNFTFKMLKVKIQSGKQLHVVSGALLPFPKMTIPVTVR